LPPKRYRPFHALIQRLASTPPGSWLLGRGLRYLDRLVIRLSGGRTSLTSILAGVPVVMVTTTGARSGEPRTSPLLPIWKPGQSGRFALIASNWGQHRTPSWYFNLKKNPHGMVAIDGRTEQYIAHEATGEEYDRFWGYAVDTYPGYALYKKRAGRRIPILVMERE
jgi:deazaflavin-dependent oxidoreductase (nitroreductase family)